MKTFNVTLIHFYIVKVQIRYHRDREHFIDEIKPYWCDSMHIPYDSQERNHSKINPSQIHIVKESHSEVVDMISNTETAFY